MDDQVLASRRQTIMREMNTTRTFPRRLLLPSLARGRRRASDEEAALESPKTPVVPTRRTNQLAPFRLSVHPRSTAGDALPAPQPAVLAGSNGSDATTDSTPAASTNSRRRADKKQKPKRFLFCFPFIKSRHVRAQLAVCFVAAVFLFSLLAVCKWISDMDITTCLGICLLTLALDLGLTLTKHVVIGELNIMLLMIILLAAVFFCYTLIRLWLIIHRGDPPDIPRAVDPRGYAVPRTPIRVVMAQDEEAAGAENETMTMKPPAYGLWRESVVCTSWVSQEASQPS